LFEQLETLWVFFGLLASARKRSQAFNYKHWHSEFSRSGVRAQDQWHESSGRACSPKPQSTVASNTLHDQRYPAGCHCRWSGSILCGTEFRLAS